MKSILTILFVGCIIIVSSSFTQAGDLNAKEQRYREFLAGAIPTKEQSEKMLFEAEIPSGQSPSGVAYQLQNGLSDSVIIGIIITVSYIDPASTKNRTVDIYSDCRDAIPLSLIQGYAPFLHADRITNLDPKISLKEVRIRKIEG